MAVLSTNLLLLLILFFVRQNCADDYDDVTTTQSQQQNEDDVTRGSKSFDDDVSGGVKTKFLNVLERKLKTQRVGGGGGGEEVAGGQEVAGSEVKRGRSWVENTMFAWGKRHRLLVTPPRGKRSTGPHRRRWSDHSMSSWGRKRSLAASPPGNEEGLRGETGGESGEWMQRGSNGEIQTDHGRPLSGYQKRRWSEHSMSVWGKRRIPGTRGPGDGDSTTGAAVDPENGTDTEGYHPLDQGPLYPAINDRNPHQLYIALLHQRNGVPKRNWATNTMNVWGKRSTPQNIQG